MAADRWCRYREFKIIGIVFAAATLLCGLPAERAKAGIDFRDCDAGRMVRAQIDEQLPVVARLLFSKDDLVIAVNPFNFFYSPETMQWLYYRQCALVDIMRSDAGRRPPTPDEDQAADCPAVLMMQKLGLVDRFGLESIERTVNPKEMPDFEKQLGPWRRIDFLKCGG